MGRPPTGKTAMTGAERQRKRRALLAAQQPAWTPGYSDTDWRHNKFVEHLGDWLEYGDVDQVTKLLAEYLGRATGRWEQVSQKITERLASDEREAVADGKAREDWLKDHPEETRAEEEQRQAWLDEYRKENVTQPSPAAASHKIPKAPEDAATGHELVWPDDPICTIDTPTGSYGVSGNCDGDMRVRSYKIHYLPVGGRWLYDSVQLGVAKTPEEAKEVAQAHYDNPTVRHDTPRPKKTISPENRAKMRAGQAAARELSAKIEAANKVEREFEKTTGRKLGKIEALAADGRGDANVRAVAESMAEKLRQTKPPPNPYRPPPLPRTMAELDEARRRVTEERKAKRAAKKA
jgi:hypothetical protein